MSLCIPGLAVLELALETRMTPNSDSHLPPTAGVKGAAFTTTTQPEACGLRCREAKVFEDIPFYFILLASSVFYNEY